MRQKIREFAAALQKNNTNLHIELSEFDLGGAMLDVIVNGELIVMEYQPHSGIGISHVLPDEGWLRGHDAWFDELEEAESYLLGLIDKMRALKKETSN